MKVNIEQKILYQGINMVQKAVSGKSTMPILKGIYMEAVKDKGLHLIGTDLEMGIEYWIEAEVIEEGNIVLNARHLYDIIRELPKEEINLKVDSDNYECEISCPPSRFNIKGYAPEEFPQLPQVEEPIELEFPQEILKSMIEEIRFSTATDETQPALTGAFFELQENELTMAATNTYRLACTNRKIDFDLPEEKIEIILPAKTLNELYNLLEDEGKINIYLSSNYIKFKFNEIILISRLIEGQFPNYKQVIPEEYKSKIIVDREKLHKAVKRAAVIAKLDSNVLHLSTKDEKLIINSLDSEDGHAHEEVFMQIEGPDQEINIDANYLIDVLKVVKEDKVVLELIGPLNPLSLRKKGKEEEYIYLIMPVRPDST